MDEEPKKELEEPPKRISSKYRKKHIIRNEEDEPAEEPLISVLSRKGKEKVINPTASEDEAEDIDAELEAIVTRVTRRPIKTKSLFDIIAAITGEGSAAEKAAPATSQQTLSKSLLTSPKGPSKRKWGISGGVTASKTPAQKRTRSIQPRDAAPTGTPPTSPLLSKKRRCPLPHRKDLLRTVCGAPPKSGESFASCCSIDAINRGVPSTS